MSTQTPTQSQTIDDFLQDLWGDLDTVEHCDSKTNAPQSRSAPPPAPRQSRTTTVRAGERAATTMPREFVPRAPLEFRSAGVTPDEIARLCLKMLASVGSATGRVAASHIRLPFKLIENVLHTLRREQLVVLKGEAIAGDYTYVATEKGLTLAKQLTQECTYFGSAPVPLEHYVRAMQHQSSVDRPVNAANLKEAFSDLLLDPSLLNRLGPAINSGRGLFLFGEPGNGKTSIAERIARAFGTTIWIPRSLGVDGQIIRVFDPSIHEEVPLEQPDSPSVEAPEFDARWVRIRRPTVIAGGELTMDELEVSQDSTSHICEAPLQIKANGGVLLIDDFGRQRMPVDELLNRWIVPLEKRFDLMNLPNGKKVQVPFDQLVIFSTNLEPRDLVDDAFLRRIPYKIQVPNPTPKQFHQLFQLMCKSMNCEYSSEAVDYLIEAHYRNQGRELRACHPRDILLQVRNYCVFEDAPVSLTRESIDFAVNCYFSVLS